MMNCSCNFILFFHIIFIDFFLLFDIVYVLVKMSDGASAPICFPESLGFIFPNLTVFVGRHVGMADEADSKSVVGDYVWVQVPLPA